jgi:hypothetical protein
MQPSAKVELAKKSAAMKLGDLTKRECMGGQSAAAMLQFCFSDVSSL